MGYGSPAQEMSGVLAMKREHEAVRLGNGFCGHHRTRDWLVASVWLWRFTIRLWPSWRWRIRCNTGWDWVEVALGRIELAFKKGAR